MAGFRGVLRRGPLGWPATGGSKSELHSGCKMRVQRGDHIGGRTRDSSMVFPQGVQRGGGGSKEGYQSRGLLMWSQKVSTEI
jgi:hypothetical protein